MNKLFQQIRVRLIDILIGKDLCIVVNLKLNKGSSFIPESNRYYYFRNVEINNDEKGEIK